MQRSCIVDVPSTEGLAPALGDKVRKQFVGDLRRLSAPDDGSLGIHQYGVWKRPDSECLVQAWRSFNGDGVFHCDSLEDWRYDFPRLRRYAYDDKALGRILCVLLVQSGNGCDASLTGGFPEVDEQSLAGLRVSAGQVFEGMLWDLRADLDTVEQVNEAGKGLCSDCDCEQEDDETFHVEFGLVGANV